MVDADALRAEVDGGLRAAAAAWRMHVTCHLFGGALRDAHGAIVVPAAWHLHRAPACLRAKRAGGNAACIAHDLRDLPAAFAGREAPAWRTCHAGVRELIVPVRHAGRLAALLYLAPRSGEGADLPAAGRLLAGWLAQIAVRLAEGRELGGDRRLTVITAFLDGHLAEDPALADLAGHLALSPERSRHLVRELTGLSFRGLKERHRLDLAQRLLAHGWQPVQEVARRCGCADPAWFGRWFRRRTGEAPGRWRALHREA